MYYLSSPDIFQFSFDQTWKTTSRPEIQVDGPHSLTETGSD